MASNELESLMKELERSKKKRDRLARLVASAGRRTREHWVRHLDEINTHITEIESKISKGGDAGRPFDLGTLPNIKEQLAEVNNSVKETINDIKSWVCRKGGLLLICLLVFVAIVIITHRYLMSREKELSLENEVSTINVYYPQFIPCHKYFEMPVCAKRKKNMMIEMEFQPPSNEFWIKEDSWNRDFDLTNHSRDDWRPQIIYEPRKPLWRNLCPKEKMTLLVKNASGKQIIRKDITLTAIRFYYPLTYVTIIFCGLVTELRARVINLSLNLLKDRKKKGSTPTNSSINS